MQQHCVMEDEPCGRAPGDLCQDTCLDHTTRAGLAACDAAVRSLCSSDEEPFDLDPDGLNDFLNRLDQRAGEFGWDDNVLVIENDFDDFGGPGTCFLEAHGEFSLEHVQAVEEHCNAETSRTSQNGFMPAKAILASLTSNARTKIHQPDRKKDWMLDIDVGDNNIEELTCGACLLKVVLDVSQQETRSTLSNVLKQLGDLQPLMEEVDCSITNFNLKVHELLLKLSKAQRREPETLLMSLFQVCGQVPDQEFQDFIKRKKNSCNEESLDITPTQLMKDAESKHHDLTNIEKTWRAPSDRKLTEALAAKLQVMENELKRQNRKPTGNQPSEATGTTSNPNRRPRKPDWLAK